MTLDKTVQSTFKNGDESKIDKKKQYRYSDSEHCILRTCIRVKKRRKRNNEKQNRRT